MKTDRLNALTDGVIAIILTIMVLELHVPQGNSLAALRPALPLLAAYALAFVNVGIFWSNHHHMVQAARRVDGRVLWANLFLLFWLSLVPFIIRWIGEEGLTRLPVAGYGLILTMSAVGYSALEAALIAAEGEGSAIRSAVGGDTKARISLAAYTASVPIALWIHPWVSIAIYLVIALAWLVPDRRFEPKGTR